MRSVSCSLRQVTIYTMLFALCTLSLSGCQGAFFQIKPPLENEGEVYLYIQPFPQEADRLRYTVAAISALSSDGREYPLSLSLHELKGPDMKRQRLLASGDLPPGRYTGFLLKVKDAILTVEDGEAKLLSPVEPVPVSFSFVVVRKKASLISLAFKYAESIQGEISFSPIFSVFIPARPILSLVGYVTNSASNNITVFDKKAEQAVAVIATGSRPAGMAMDQIRRRAYVALSGDDSIEVVDIATGDILNRIRLNQGDRTQELALSPNGKLLITVNPGSNTASFVNPISLLEVSRLSVGNGPNSVLLDSTGRRAYVFNTLSSTISVIDIANKALITTISTDRVL